jgi:hypothetical protein
MRPMSWANLVSVRASAAATLSSISFMAPI